jgi:hypothetical protein
MGELDLAITFIDLLASGAPTTFKKYLLDFFFHYEPFRPRWKLILFEELAEIARS